MSNMYNVGQGPSPANGLSCVVAPNLGSSQSGGPTLHDAPMVSVANPYLPCGPSSCSTGACCGNGAAPGGGPPGDPPSFKS
jgi:hypothetical protein